MKNLNRYTIKPFLADGVKKFMIVDLEYPIICYPLFDTRRDAQTFVAGFYGLTPEEFKDLRRRKKIFRNGDRPD